MFCCAMPNKSQQSSWVSNHMVCAATAVNKNRFQFHQRHVTFVCISKCKRCAILHYIDLVLLYMRRCLSYLSDPWAASQHVIKRKNPTCAHAVGPQHKVLNKMLVRSVGGLSHPWKPTMFHQTGRDADTHVAVRPHAKYSTDEHMCPGPA